MPMGMGMVPWMRMDLEMVPEPFVPSDSALLLEDLFYVLLEDGSRILLEN